MLEKELLMKIGDKQVRALRHAMREELLVIWATKQARGNATQNDVTTEAAVMIWERQRVWHT